MQTITAMIFSLSFIPFGAYVPSTEQEIPIVEILSEPEDGIIHKMSVTTEENGDLLQVVRKTEDEVTAFPFQSLIDGEVVFARAQDRDALILSCPECTLDTGGTIVFKYLANALNNSWKSQDFQVVKTEDGWSLDTNDGESISTMTMKSAKIFGQVVGIKVITINDW